MTAPLEPSKTIQERTTPYPPRFRWLKRLLFLFVFLIIAIILLRLWWGHNARQKLADEIAAIHARGEPILIEDFAQPTIPDQDNAAWYLIKAEQAYVSSKAVEEAPWQWDQKSSPQMMALLRQYLLSNARAMQWIRMAHDKPNVSWDTKIASPVNRVTLPHLNWAHTLCELLRMNAYTMHQDQHDAQALESIRDNLRLASANGQQMPCIITHLTETGMIAVASNITLNIATDLQIDAANTTTRPSGPASRQQVLALIGELLNDRPFDQNLVRALYGERLLEYDSMVNVIGPQPGQNPLVQKFMQPEIDLTAVHMMRTVTAEAQACAQPDYQDVIARLPNIKQDQSLMRSIDQLLSSILAPGLKSAIKVHFNIVADRRAAAIALAVRLWQVDHPGKFPPNLQTLVPAYLPAIPIDPFAKDQSPFRYKSDTPVGPIIYSVGENGVDDGGSITPLPTFPKHTQEFDRYDRLDIVYPLRPPPPSTETGDNGVNQ